jgi:hypothetical protein
VAPHQGGEVGDDHAGAGAVDHAQQGRGHRGLEEREHL